MSIEFYKNNKREKFNCDFDKFWINLLILISIYFARKNSPSPKRIDLADVGTFRGILLIRSPKRIDLPDLGALRRI